MQCIRSGIEILRSRKSLAVVAGMKKTQNRQKSKAKRKLKIWLLYLKKFGRKMKQINVFFIKIFFGIFSTCGGISFTIYLEILVFHAMTTLKYIIFFFRISVLSLHSTQTFLLVVMSWGRRTLTVGLRSLIHCKMWYESLQTRHINRENLQTTRDTNTTSQVQMSRLIDSLVV